MCMAVNKGLLDDLKDLTEECGEHWKVEMPDYVGSVIEMSTFLYEIVMEFEN